MHLINIVKCTLFVLLFRMRTADDLRNYLLMFKNDIDEHYKLLVNKDGRPGKY